MQAPLGKVDIVPIGLTPLPQEIMKFLIGQIRTQYLTLKPHQVLQEWCLEIALMNSNKKLGCDRQCVVKAIAFSDFNL